MIRNQPHGFQKELAKKIKISPQYLERNRRGSVRMYYDLFKKDFA